MCCKIHSLAKLTLMCVTETAAAFSVFAFENTSKNSKAGKMWWQMKLLSQDWFLADLAV